MKKRIIVILLVTAFVMMLIPNVALAAEPSLVSSMDYNGHHYEVYYQSGISWTNAKAYAENMEYNAERGYLATVTTMGEHYAVASLNPSYADSFLGARGTIGDRVSTWKWVTGPEAGQSVMGSRPPWMSGEPNSSSEKYLIIRANNLWDNRAVTNIYVKYFIVEYGGMGPIPEPSYDITYNNVAGAANSNPSSYCASDTPLTLQDLGARGGYTFGGWYDNLELSGSAVTAIPEGVTGAQTFWAKWTQDDYTVSYSGNGSDGGTLPNDDTVYHYEDEVTVLTGKPTKTGYTFGGWSDGTNVYGAGDKFDMPADNVTLTAQWIAIEYAVTYSGNENDGGTVPNDDTIYHYEDEVTVLSDQPTKTGYTFSGWIDGTDTYNSGDKFDMPADDVTLTAQWTAIDYTVTYSGNGHDGGTVPSDDTVYHYEDEVTVQTDEPTKTGYTFGGWSDGTNMYDNGDKFDMPADNVELMAQWTAIDYTVTYNGNGSNGGTVPNDDTVYHYEDEVTVQTDEPTKTGYTFSGWSEGTNKYDGNDKFDMPADNVMLTAQWTAIDYTVTYNGNGSDGGVVPSEDTIYHYKDEVTILSDEPTKTGYTFGGWNDGTNTYDGNDTFKMSVDNVTLTAQWTAIDYSVSYDGNSNSGGIVPEDTLLHYEDTVTIPSDEPKRKGYTFSGWGYGSQVFNSGDTFVMPDDDVVLTAKWNKKRISSVTISSSEELALGEGVTLTAEVLPSDAIYSITWTSSDETVATVDENGRITAVGEGHAKITAEAGGRSDVCAVSVGTGDASSSASPKPEGTPRPSLETETNSEDENAQLKTISIIPGYIEEDEDTGTYVIKINVNDLPDGTAAVKTQNGQIIEVGDNKDLTFTVNDNNIGDSGSIIMIALDEEGIPFSEYEVKVKSDETIIAISGADGAANSTLPILLIVTIGSAAAGAILLIILIRRRKNKAG